MRYQVRPELLKWMNLSAGWQNWKTKMKLDNRITKLENAIAPKQFRHVILSPSQEQTEQEIIVQYCAETGLDTDEFKNKDDYLIIQLVPLKRN